MDAKTKEVYNAYMRTWRKSNKDKVKDYNSKYWKKKAVVGNDINAGTKTSKINK